MKVSNNTRVFKPVTITLETLEESQTFTTALQEHLNEETASSPSIKMLRSIIRKVEEIDIIQ